MIYSTDRILTTHAGSLPRPGDLRDLVTAKSNGEPVDEASLNARITAGVADVVIARLALPVAQAVGGQQLDAADPLRLL